MTEGRTRIEVEGIPEFWDVVTAAEQRCLVLDYDGTLAPFREDRMRAFPLEGIRELLIEIRDTGKTHLAMMTGRPLDELLALLGDLDVPMSGSQGTEFRFPDGTTQTHLPDEVQESRLVRGEKEARALAPDYRVERKTASVAVHTRGMSELDAARIEDALCGVWSADAEEHELECRRFCGGLELRIKGIDKGTALRTLLNTREGKTLCVYVGDDDTDEDAFEVVREHGFGIKVGSQEDPTAATGKLPGPEAVREFLIRWLATTAGK
jgi:trehalose-phosphatase